MASSDAQGLTLLVGLAEFIRPYIDAYVTAMDGAGTTSLRQVRADFDARAERVCGGAQGKELLSALGKFVKDLVMHDEDVDAMEVDEPVSEKDNSTQPWLIPVQQRVFIDKRIATKRKELSPVIVNQVQQHVFSEMPIRMLAFEYASGGTQLRLVERSAIVEIIKSRISEGKWQKLDESKSLELVKRYARYAILSHTWFRGKPGDVVYGNWKDRELNPEGNSKIVKFCETAARNHFVRFGWMDTVCIDKSSSTELDESIRSMYRWYKQSYTCITYLADTSQISDIHRDTWFTRAWTLQELLAPRNMAFYSKDWTFLDHNDRRITTDFISVKTFTEATNSQIFQATTINRDEIEMCSKGPTLLPISRVFQLASLRNVTREEDRVYSLMGLLGVSMSVAYGEGLASAFNRLIREIMVTKGIFLDIFNHSNQEELIPKGITEYRSRSPLFDQTSIHKSTTLHDYVPIAPISMTHLGVHVPILLIPLFSGMSEAAVPISSEILPLSVYILMASKHSDYHFLRQNDTSFKFIADFTVKPADIFQIPSVIFCGILNFSKSSSGYRTSDGWLYVLFELHTECTPSLITDIEERDLDQMSGPQVLLWPSDHSPGYKEIREQNIQKMGMKVTQLYLH